MGGNPLAKTYEEIKTFAQDVIDNLRGREPHSLLAKPFNDVAAENVVNRGRDYALILKSGNDPKIGAVNAELDKSGAPAVTMGAIQFTKDPATMKWSAGVPSGVHADAVTMSCVDQNKIAGRQTDAGNPDAAMKTLERPCR